MKLTLNLAGRTYLNRRALRFAYGVVAFFLLLVLGMLSYGYLRDYRQLAQVGQWLLELETRGGIASAPARPPLSGPERERLLSEVDFANGILRMDGFRWTRLLDQLEEVLPETVGIQAIRPDYAQGSFSLTGQARDLDALRGLLDNLSASPEFSDVYLLQQALRENPAGGSVIGFSLEVKGAF
ncbi:MAG: PilN domain-containing protein [Trichloromonas sp.]|jgi:type IV pilus assembly protein PilN|nr:PilN domain-containing protein [Trichloromonas sp.]